MIIQVGGSFLTKKISFNVFLAAGPVFEQNTVQVLLHSMNARAIEVVERQEGPTHYLVLVKCDKSQARADKGELCYIFDPGCFHIR